MVWLSYEKPKSQLSEDFRQNHMFGRITHELSKNKRPVHLFNKYDEDEILPTLPRRSLSVSSTLIPIVHPASYSSSAHRKIILSETIMLWVVVSATLIPAQSADDEGSTGIDGGWKEQLVIED